MGIGSIVQEPIATGHDEVPSLTHTDAAAAIAATGAYVDRAVCSLI
jgi:hypothetical protein